MNSGVSRLVSSRLFLWLAAAVIGSYFLFAIKKSEIQQGEGSFVTRVFRSIHIPSISLGIDLQGGTRFVLHVDVAKAVENRLADSSKMFDRAFRKAQIVSPVERLLAPTSLSLVFTSPEIAGKAVDLLKKNFPEFTASRSDAKVEISLSSKEAARIKATSVDQAVQVLRTRLDAVDVRGLTVNRHGDEDVVVQLPGVDDVDAIKQMIMRAARLEFKIVDKQKYSRESLLDEYDGVVPADKVLLPGKEADGDEGQWYAVSAFADCTGDRIQDARFTYDEHGAPAVGFTLDSEGGREFRELTRRNIGRQLAIIMDDQVISAPHINSEIGRSGSITNMKADEAVKMAALLRSGALAAPLKIEQESRIGASLGQDSIHAGILACVIAMLLLLVVSVWYYGFAGILAILALVYNALFVLLALAYFKATLTLPGLAGMVLSIGTAIDASILIFERIREELRTGKAFRASVPVGFKGAASVIVDANITTLITGIVLFWFGGPAVRGFAVTLMLGIVATLLSGIFFLRAMVDFVVDGLDRENIGIKP